MGLGLGCGYYILPQVQASSSQPRHYQHLLLTTADQRSGLRPNALVRRSLCFWSSFPLQSSPVVTTGKHAISACYL